MQVDAFLEVVDLTAVRDEGHRAFCMEQFIFVGVLFKEEVVPWSSQKFHRHRMALADLHRWVAQVKVRDAAQCGVVGKGMTGFVGQ